MEKSRNEFVNLLEWIGNNRLLWEEICTGENLSASTCRQMIEELRKAGFFQLICVVLTRNYCNMGVEAGLLALVINKFSADWDSKTADEVVNEIQTELSIAAKKFSKPSGKSQLEML